MAVLATIGAGLAKAGGFLAKNAGTIAKVGAPLLGGLLGGSSEGANATEIMQKQFENQKALNEQSYDLTQKGYREQYKNLRKGLEDAGYNPMLAYSNSPNATFAGGSASASSPDKAQLRESLTNATRLAVNEIRQTTANINATNAQAQLAKEQALSEINRRENYDADSLLKYTQAVLNDKEASWYEKKTAMQLRVSLMQAQASQVASNASMINAETTRDITNFDKNRYMRWMRNHKMQESFTYGLGQWTGSLGKLFSGSANLSSSHKR